MDINGLQINFGLEENGIKRNLTEIKNSFREVNSSVRLTDKLFDKAERSIDEYNDELNKLGRSSKILENNLTGLEDEMKSLDTTTAKGKKKMTQLRTEYNKQAMTALKLEERYSKLNNEYNKLSSSQKLIFSSNSKMVRSFQTVQARIQATNQRINKLGDSFRNFGYVVRGMGMGVLISNLSAIVPLGGSAISVLAGIGGMATASAGGVMGLAGAYGIAYAGIGAFAAQAGTALKMVEDGEMKATAELDKYQSSLSGLTNQWKGLVQSNQADIFNTMSNGINIARHALTQLTPFITKTTSQIAQFSTRMLEWVQSSKNASGAFNMLNQVGPPIFQNILNSIFKVTDGLVHMMTRFAPLFTWVGAGLENMANKFNTWANSTSTDNGITRFIEYTKTNLPLVGQIFGNIFSGIISLFQAFAGHSHTVMVGMAGVTNTFKEWAANLSGTKQFENFIAYLNENGPKVWQLLKNIGSILVSVIQGMAPIGTLVLNMTLAFTGFIAKITQGNPVLGAMIGILSMVTGASMALYPALSVLSGVLGPVFGWLLKVTGAAKLVGPVLTALSGPVGWITLGIVALGTALVVAYKKSETFRNIVNGAFTAIVNGAKLLWSGIITILTPMGQAFVKFGGEIKNAIGDFWAKYGAQFMQAITNIRNGFAAFWAFIQPVLGFMGGLFKSTFSDSIPVINLFKNLIMGSLVHAFNIVKNSVKIAFNAIKGIIMGVLNVVMGFVKMFIGIFTGDWRLFGEGLKQIVRSFLSIIKNLFQLTFSGILAVVKVIWGVIKNTIVNLAQSIFTGVRNRFNSLKNSITTIFNIVKNFLYGIWLAIKNKVVSLALSLYNGVRNRFNSLKNSVVSIFNTVRNFLYKLWTAVRNKVVSLATSLYNGVRSRFNSLKNSITTIFNIVKNFLFKIWASIRSKVVSLATSLYNGVRNRFNSLKNSITSIFNSVRNFLYDIWNKIRNKVVSIATSLYNGVRNKFNNLKNSIKSIMGKVKNNLYDVWDKIWNKVTGVASSLWSTVRGTFQNMKDGIKGFADKIGGTINDMVGGIKKGLNKLIEGVNWVGGKLGIDKKIPKLSTGTDGASNSVVSNGAISSPTLATVNDRGPGNGSGIGGHQEVIQRANGQMFAPKGRDVTVPLGKGDIVHSGRSVQKAQKAGVLPKFSRGTNKKKKYDLLKDAKKNKHKHGGMDAIGTGLAKNSAWGVSGGGVLDDLKRVTGAGAKVGAKKVTKKAADTTKKGKEAVDTGKKVVEAGAKSAAKIGGDLLDYVGSPGKLVNAMLKKFGVDFGNVKGEIPKDMMWDGMWKGLKGGVKSLFDGWLTEADGAGDGGYIDLSHGINYGFGFPPGYPFNRPHNGLDIGYPYGSKLYSTLGGTAVGTNGYNGGFGNNMTITSGSMKAIYGHMSKLAWTGSKKVKPGDYLGLSGGDPARQGKNAGDSTGPHLHYEMQRNGKPFDPTNWLKTNNGGGKNKKASAWKGDIKKAAKRMKVNLRGNDLNNIVSLINAESTGNAGAVQNGVNDINSRSGNPAKGLLQYIPQTFKSYAMKGHGNIMSGYDQLLAFFNNKSWRSQFNPNGGWSPSGARRFATGGIINSEGMYNLAEDGHSEVVVPLDPARANDAMKLIGYAQSKIQGNKNKRPNDMSNKYGSQSDGDNTNLLLQMIANQQKQLDALMEIARSNKGIEDKNYFPNSREMTKMNNENMALNSATQLMR
ncbi:peptidoglycan DD-metalloendopeptidase family protein [Staphylococcus equorum]|uniref:peptidoglycan DD-metalloendopeptidase family protein n=1 Tax=Staphylococcus equorum TaxID=246432 RepID=UPI003EB9D543